MSFNNHKVSIITPSYNSQQFICETVNSVINQTYTNWEMLIVDDKSKDNSVAIIKSLQKKDKRIKLFELPENSGAAVSRNLAIEKATGKFIAFLDSDDLWLPNKLEKQIDFMEAKNCKLSFTSYALINEAGQDLKKYIRAKPVINYENMLSSNKIGCLTAVYDQESLGKIYMPLLRKRQDYGLWLKIMRKGTKAYGMHEVLSKYRKRKGSVSNNKLEMLIWNWKLFKQEEKLSTFRALYYVAMNIVNKLAAN